MLGRLLTIYYTQEGKVALAFFAMSGLLFRMLASRMRAHLERDRRERAKALQKTEEEETT